MPRTPKERAAKKAEIQEANDTRRTRYLRLHHDSDLQDIVHVPACLENELKIREMQEAIINLQALNGPLFTSQNHVLERTSDFQNEQEKVKLIDLDILNMRRQIKTLTDTVADLEGAMIILLNKEK